MQGDARRKDVNEMKKAWMVSLSICFLCMAGGIACWYTSQNFTKIWPLKGGLFNNDSNEDYEKALAYIQGDKPAKAVQIIKKYRILIEKNNQESAKWLDLLIKACVELPDVNQLTILFPYRPTAFYANEEASIMLAEAYLLSGKLDEYHKLREMWQGRETKKSNWLGIDADLQILSGNREKAIELLNKESFSEKDDVNRLIQLSLLTMNEHPKQALKYLMEADQKDPNNSTILSYRARLLELTNQIPLALAEYIAATTSDPSNLALKDQLGEFFIRYKHYHQAIQVYEDTVKNFRPNDVFYLKTAFLGKIIRPLDAEITKKTLLHGKFKPLVEYILQLPQNKFWDELAFSAIPMSEKILETQQVTWWLRLLSALQDNDLIAAEDLLKNNRFAEIAWSPEVSLALKRILNYQKNQTLSLVNSSFEETNLEKQSTLAGNKRQTDFFRQLHALINQLKDREVSTQNSPFQAASVDKLSELINGERQIDFFKQLNDLAAHQVIQPNFLIPKDLQKLLNSPLAYSAVFLAIGWNEAALILGKAENIAEDFPDWVAYGFAQAVRKKEGATKALEYVMLQPQIPLIRLLAAELMVSQNDKEAAINQLTPLAKEEGAIGARAAWFLSLLYLNEGEYHQAKEVIDQNENFAKSILGIESSARIALAEENFDVADRLYTSIAEQSLEAKSYLSRKAYQEKNWQQAKKLTIELLSEFPDSPILKQNLLLILEGL